MMKVFSFFFLIMCLSSNWLQAQTEPYDVTTYGCEAEAVPNVTLGAVGGFDTATPNGDGTVTLCLDLQNDLGIDPVTVSADFTASLYFDNGFNSAEFTTSNGQSVTGTTNPRGATTGGHFAYATLANDGSGQVCATVDGTADGLPNMSFFVTIEHGTLEGAGITATSFIDNEILKIDDNNQVECEVGVLSMATNGTAADQIDVDISFSISEVELGDTRTIDVAFEACGVTYAQTIDPEPLAGVPGVAILDVSLPNVPGDCTELSYSFCSNQGQQSFAIGGIATYYGCVPTCAEINCLGVSVTIE